ncbi:hypothetical protein Pcinc_022949 [Petrolisthes cinctipes]|uniref:Uncharacterized protein n=1 Tax=Petrolisthes cinctipes TaxID=88211 RepID=A0AAE1FFB7_PETCI|nr:hypothetical protein Pcinc_022949 [Petrolisthes cinctipes]
MGALPSLTASSVLRYQLFLSPSQSGSTGQERTLSYTSFFTFLNDPFLVVVIGDGTGLDGNERGGGRRLHLVAAHWTSRTLSFAATVVSVIGYVTKTCQNRGVNTNVIQVPCRARTEQH